MKFDRVSVFDWKNNLLWPIKSFNLCVFMFLWSLTNSCWYFDKLIGNRVVEYHHFHVIRESVYKINIVKQFLFDWHFHVNFCLRCILVKICRLWISFDVLSVRNVFFDDLYNCYGIWLHFWIWHLITDLSLGSSTWAQY